jgi:DNA-binding NtrC family response regulator
MTKRLLVVDDDTNITAIVSRIANDIGYQVMTLNSAETAVAAFVAFAPDVLLIDLVMPGTDGIDLLRQVLTTGRRTRVVTMTGFGQGYFRLAKAVAAFEHLSDITELPKPFRRADIVAMLAGPAMEDRPKASAGNSNEPVSSGQGRTAAG